MNAKGATIVNLGLIAVLIALVDLIEDMLTIDVFLNIGIIGSVFIASFVGSVLNDESSKEYIIYSSIVYTAFASIAAFYIYSVCTGLACLGTAIFVYSIPIFIIIFGISTYLQNYFMSDEN